MVAISTCSSTSRVRNGVVRAWPSSGWVRGASAVARGLVESAVAVVRNGSSSGGESQKAELHGRHDVLRRDGDDAIGIWTVNSSCSFERRESPTRAIAMCS